MLIAVSGGRSKEETAMRLMLHMSLSHKLGRRPCHLVAFVRSLEFGVQCVSCGIDPVEFALDSPSFSGQEQQAIIKMLLSMPNSMVNHRLNQWQRILDDDLV